jgi:RNA polymerase sigma-70 factor (ECF subfamily)
MRHQHSSLDQSIYVEATGDVLSTLSGEEILKMVNGLSPAYRAVFNLHVIEGYSHSEIAALLGIEEGTSKSNLAKAKVKLQKMILTHQAVKTEQYGRESQR